MIYIINVNINLHTFSVFSKYFLHIARINMNFHLITLHEVQ